MKKINLLFVVLFATIISVTTGCKKDDPTGPTLTISADKSTAWLGDSITFTYSVASNADLKTLSYSTSAPTIVPDGEVALSGTSVQNQELSIVLPTTGLTDGSSITFTFVAEDKDGADYADTKEITISLAAPVVTPSITAYSALLMGASSSSYGSFLATSNGTVYTQADAITNSALIDIVYRYDASAKLYSPDDAAVVTALTVKNSTKFAAYAGTSTFANIDAIEINSISAPTSLTKTADLTVGNILVFVTDAGKKGVAEVTALNPGTSGDIKLNIKVQD